MRFAPTLLACSLALSIPSAALALTQPDGTTIPTTGSLQTLFDGRGEAINALGDALTVPETFVPSCGLTFQVLQRNAGYQNSFGWYNVTGQQPGLQDLHEFLTCTDGVGTIKTLAIKNDPAYAGGQIGFYEATGNCATIQNHDYIFYSEKKYNPDGNQANPFIHLLIYNSTVTPKAFYFGWEDLLAGGDNDFDDLTTFVTGISCAGGGGKCQTGSPGVCGDGTLQCQNGQLQCLPLVGPSAESCDGFDNDCNGSVDDGDICPAGKVCDNGNCVPKCGDGEFVCDADQACDPAKGLCVDPACVNVACPAGTKCVKGQCKDPCNGVVCPTGQACIAGNCIDPCLAITCDDNQVCKDGACIDKCQCAGCPAANQCQGSGLCVPDGCINNPCEPGQVCQPDGTCADACSNVVCPTGQLCQAGQCVKDPNMGGGGTGGAGGGFTFGGDGGSTMTTSSSAGGATSSNGGGGATSTGGTSDGSKGSCGCKAAGSEPSEAGALFAIGLVGLLTARRRRRVA
ncbi:MAG: DUF4114 domain-containing protein [Polyangiaceae bacterium]